MSANLRIDNVLIQVRSKLQEDGVKLWLSPYYEEGIGSNDDEIEVGLYSSMCGFYLFFLMINPYSYLVSKN